MNRSRIKNHIWRVIEKNIHLVDTWPLKSKLLSKIGLQVESNPFPICLVVYPTFENVRSLFV